jgi:hypothetical protein
MTSRSFALAASALSLLASCVSTPDHPATAHEVWTLNSWSWTIKREPRVSSAHPAPSALPPSPPDTSNEANNPALSP